MLKYCFVLQFHLGRTVLGFHPCNNKYAKLLQASRSSYGLTADMVEGKKRKQRRCLSKFFMCSNLEHKREKSMSESIELPKVGSASVSYDALLESIRQVEIKVGDVRIGRIVRVAKEGLFIYLGMNNTAFLPRQELWLEENKLPHEVYKEGDELEVEILPPKDNFELVVSELAVRRRKCWEKLKEFQLSSKSFLVLVLGFRNNGLIVRYDCIEGYLPIEHLIPSHTASQVMNTELEVRVLNLDVESSNLVVSQRLAVAGKREKELKVGSVTKGVVRAIRDYGVVVDLFGVLGLLFVKDISREPVADPSSVFTVGETIYCMVIHIDRKRHRIILSTSALELHSGEMLKDKAKVFERKSEALNRVRKILDERSSQRKCFFGNNLTLETKKE